MQELLQEKKAQGGLEYLFILAGAILVAVLVGKFLKDAAATVGGRASEATSGATNPKP